MKYWNKDKRIRQEHWFPVRLRHRHDHITYSLVKRQLQHNSSTGKFYLYYGGNTVWFEQKQDAVWFTLTQ
jgi:hypothetical protein